MKEKMKDIIDFIKPMVLNEIKSRVEGIEKKAKAKAYAFKKAVIRLLVELTLIIIAIIFIASGFQKIIKEILDPLGYAIALFTTGVVLLLGTLVILKTR